MGCGNVHWRGIIGRKVGHIWRKRLEEGKNEFSLGPIQFEVPEGHSNGNKSLGYVGQKVKRSLSAANDIKG